MEEIVGTKRYHRGHYSQVTKDDGSKEEFNTIRGGIAFPQDNTPGIILTGGILRGGEVVKVIFEKEFNTLSEAVRVAKVVHEKMLPYRLYYQDLPENEAFGVFLQRNASQRLSIQAAPYSEKLDFGIPLINDFLSNDRLIVPKGSVISKQLQTNWANFSHEQGALNAITALFCLLSGLVHEPWDSGLCSEAALENCWG